MILAEGNHMVHQLATATAYPPFGHTILPGTPIHSQCRLQTEGFDGLDNQSAERGIPIGNHVSPGEVKGKRLS